MDTHLMTYGDELFENSKRRLQSEGHDFGAFDSVQVFDPNDLSPRLTKLLESLPTLTRHTRGKTRSHFLWKPYIIKEKLKNIKNNDFLIYLDAGCSISNDGIDRFHEYLEMLDESKKGVLSFCGCHLEKVHTITRIFNHLKIKTDSDEALSGQLFASALIMQKNDHLIEMIDEWQDIADKKPLLFTDVYSDVDDNHQGFVENRHDQSVFSLIRKKHGTLVIPDECYPVTDLSKPFLSTRIRN
jgi:hypothetical protein